jgi:hypothetical protein
VAEHVDLQRLVSENARATKRLSSWVRGLAAMCGIMGVCLILLLARTSVHAQSTADIVTARGLVIVDEYGKTRVRIGAPLPEPIIMGKQEKRDDSISGILIYDRLGNERGGYVTDNSVGNAFLTLDSNSGQEVTLVAYPKGGAEFELNDDAKNKVVLSASKSGPMIRLLRTGTAIFQQPPSSVTK